MRLSELKVGDELIVKSYYFDKKHYGAAEASFTTTCIEVHERGILTGELCTDEGTPINFESPRVCSDLYLIKVGEHPVLWKNVIIRHTSQLGIKNHIIVARNSGQRYNRRASFRVLVGAKAVARLGVSRTTADVYVKDISLTGFAISIESKYDVGLHDAIRVTYEDSGHTFAVEGICIRKQKVSEDRVICGCVLNTRSKALAEYIAEKQRLLAKKNSTV